MRASATPRVAITLAPGERDALHQLARQRGEAPATTAGRLVRAALLDHGAHLDQPPARRNSPGGPHRPPAGRLTHREPADAIDALRARYPLELRHAPIDPAADALVNEALIALARWRADLDAAGDEANPRETLYFCDELRRTATWLQDRARRGR
ncbi:MAG TPA: hypothetical protein VFU94_04720 [Conexibacter sp.]|nr:hypothetical protein [Conexibacter sp.]